jgi:hypothetical protein
VIFVFLWQFQALRGHLIRGLIFMIKFRRLLRLWVLPLALVACTVPTPAAPNVATTTPAAGAVASADEALFPLTITDAAGQEFTFDARSRSAAPGRVVTSLWPTWG